MKAAAGIFLMTLAGYILTAGGHLYSPDEEILFRTARALAHGDGLLIKPLDPSGFATVRPEKPDPSGLEYAQYGIGQPLLAVPLEWIGERMANLGDDAFWRRAYGRDASGYLMSWGVALNAEEIAPRFALSWFNILLSPCLAVLIFLLCMEIVQNRGAAATAALLYAFGSLAWPHSRPFFSEVSAAFFLLLAFYALVRALGRPHFGWYLLAGAAAGYAFLVRTDSVIFFPGLAVAVIWPTIERRRFWRRSFWPDWLAFGLPLMICGAIWMWLNWVRFGGVLSLGHKDQPEGIAFSTPVLAGLYGLLFSVGKGIFFFSPALALSFLGWRHLADFSRKLHPSLLPALAVMLLAFLIFHAKWQNWAGGWTWGPRHIFQLHVFLALPIAAWLERCWGPASRVVVIAAFVAGMGVQLLGSSQDFVTFHQRFFRAPGDASAFWVYYDRDDTRFWQIDGPQGYFQMMFRGNPAEAPRPINLLAPAPIQNSLFVPQHSVWSGYPVMLNEGSLDNLWVRLARSR